MIISKYHTIFDHVLLHYNTSHNTITLTIKVRFNIRDHTIMIREVSFIKRLFFLTVLPRNVSRNPVKSQWWSIFAKIANDLPILQRNSIMFDWVQNIAVLPVENNERNYLMKNLKLYGPLLWMEFNCLKATELLRGNSLLFTTQSPGGLGTDLIDLRRMKG